MAIGEIFLAAFLQVLLEKLSSPALRLFLKLVGRGKTRKTIQQWESQLRMIEAVLAVAEQQQLLNNAIKSWLQDLQDLAYDMEDILDEFAIQAHAHHLKVLNNAPATGFLGSTKKKVISLAVMLNPISRVKSQPKINNITDRLQNIQTQIPGLNLTMSHFIQQQTLQIEAFRQQRESTSLVPMVFGRDEKKNEIITQLLKDDQSDENYAVIPIVGKGGIGKTTLAQYVYNDEQQLKGRFDLKAWVCVSDVFDIKRITTTIITAVSRRTARDLSNLNEAQEKLKQELMGKKFFIVLDDIWNENYDDWDLLRKPFQHAAKGSRVIMTTRNEKIANIMMVNSSINKINIIEDLSGDDCWRIFQQHANEDPDLAEMQEDIKYKCKGLPLAAKALAGLLKKTAERRQRQEILESNIWSEDSEHSSVLPVLRLSYHHLPTHLKLIFAYCAVFPKDYIFQKDEVVLLWMAQGFLPENQTKRMEDIGHDYFSELVSRSLFEARPSVTMEFTMHDLIHDLALWAADDLCRVIDTINVSQRDFRRTRHVSIRATTLTNQLPMASKMRSFYWLEDVKGIENLDFIQRFRYVRTMRLVSHNIEMLPESIGELKHLRYLHLNIQNLKELPKSMGNLWNLQTLWLEHCAKLQKLPNMRFLGKLRHLRVGTLVSALEEMPMGIGELTNLHSLDQFVLGDGRGERIRDLKNLNHLHGKLTISGLESVLKVEDAKEAQLDKKDSLHELCLSWGYRRYDVDDNTKRDVVEQLKHHSSIKHLRLNGYRGSRFPTWLGNPCFSKMVGISLVNCEKCEYLPPLGQLPSLKNLSITGMDGITEIGLEFYGDLRCQNPSFPVLESLTFKNMRSLEKWMHSPAHVRGFPCLKDLSIQECRSLVVELPPFLPCLTKLRIKECEELNVSLNSLPLLEVLEVEGSSSIQFTSDETIVKTNGVGCSSIVGLQCEKPSYELKHLTKLTIKCCSTRISLPGDLLLPAVEHIAFKDCQDLGSLPCQLHKFNSLKNLTIDCVTMEEFPDGGLPINLEELTLSKVVTKQQERGLVVHHLHSLRSLKLEHANITLEDLCVTSSLRHLFINNLHSLKTISSCTTLSDLTSLPVYQLQYLELYFCNNIESLPSQLHKYTCLKTLKITGCPKIQKIPEGGLPINLKELKIEHVNIKQRVEELAVHHLHSLRSLELIEVGMTPEVFSLPSSLSRLIIWDSQNLRTISSCNTVSNLTELLVSYCPMFESLVGNFTSLSHLRIQNCPNFEFSAEGGLPRNLNRLELYERMNRDKPMREWGLHLLSSLEVLNLIDLGRSTTESVECIPSPNLQPPSSLSELVVNGFQKLECISCSSFLNMTTLIIRKCPKFQSFGDHCLPPKLQNVKIEACESIKPHLKIDHDGPIRMDRCRYSLL